MSLANILSLTLISIVVSFIFAPIMINLLYRLNMVQVYKKTKIGAKEGETNELYMKILEAEKHNNTPNMGGIMIWVLAPLLSLLLLELNTTLRVLLIGFAIHGFVGLLDQVFTNLNRNNPDMKARQETFEWRLGKLLFTILINTGILYLMYSQGVIEEIGIKNLITIQVGPVVAILLGFVSQFAVYSTEIIDGLDGLLVGISIVQVVIFMFLLSAQGDFVFIPFLAILLGILVVDLYFNIPPARFWNGGPGAMPLGFMFFFIGLATNNLIPYVLITSVYWVTLASSALQILSMKFFKRRVFPIAPLHLTFLSMGWPHYKVTMRYWLVAIVMGLLGLLVGVL